MDSVVWVVVITVVVGLIAALTMTWALGSVHRDRERAAVAWGRRILAAQDEERRSIARELHDSVVPELISLDLALVGSTHSVRGEASRIADRVRDLSRLMHPGILDHLTMDEALRHLTTVADWPFTITLDADVMPSLSDDAKLACYRIVQEALSNVRRHAAATKVTITAQCTDSEYVVAVHDDGKGFEVPQLDTLASLGLRSMSERALAAGGRFTITSAPGHGATTSVAMPRAAP